MVIWCNLAKCKVWLFKISVLLGEIYIMCIANWKITIFEFCKSSNLSSITGHGFHSKLLNNHRVNPIQSQSYSIDISLKSNEIIYPIRSHIYISHTRWCPSWLAKLVNIAPITMVHAISHRYPIKSVGFQNPEVLCHLRPYFVRIFPYIGLKNRPYIW